MRTHNKWLIIGATGSAAAAFAHLCCIAFGGNGYRFFGAGEEMARMAEAGELYPSVITLGIASILTIWSLYALSGAGIIRKLPLLRPVLYTIATIYLLRSLAFVFLVPLFPENSVYFWLISSSICFLLGLSYVLGVKQIG